MRMNEKLLFRPERVQKREYWQFIRLVAPDQELPPQVEKWSSKDAIAAYCLKCKRKFRYKSGTSIQIKRHVLDYHTDCLVGSQTDGSSKKKKMDHHRSKCSPALLDSPMEYQSKESSFHALVIAWITNDYRCPDIIQDTGFLDILQYATKSSGTEMPLLYPNDIERLLQEKHISLKTDIDTTIQDEVDYYSLSLDTWFSQSKDATEYLAITIHYVSSQFVQRSFTIDVSVFPKDRNHLKCNLDKRMVEMGLDPVKLCYILSNGSERLAQLCSVMNAEQQLCVMQELHLFLSSFFHHQPCEKLKIEEIWTQMMTCFAHLQTLSRFLFMYPKAKQHFIHLCEQKKSTAKSFSRILEIVNQEDWISRLHVLEDVIQLKSIVETFIGDVNGDAAARQHFGCTTTKELHSFSQEDWAMLECIHCLLSPFLRVLHHLTTEKFPSRSMAYPLLNELKENLSSLVISSFPDSLVVSSSPDSLVVSSSPQGMGMNPPESNNSRLVSSFPESNNPPQGIRMGMGINHIKEILVEIVHNRLSKMILDEHWGILLDPRIVYLFHLDDPTKEKLTQLLIQHVITIERYCLPTSNYEAFDMNIKRLFSLDQQIAVTRTIHEDERIHLAAKKEVEEYMKTCITCPPNPFSWWRSNSSRFPRLVILARVWLGTEVTSCREMQLLNCRDHYRSHLHRRSELPQEMVETMVFLHNNADQ